MVPSKMAETGGESKQVLGMARQMERNEVNKSLTSLSPFSFFGMDLGSQQGEVKSFYISHTLPRLHGMRTWSWHSWKCLLLESLHVLGSCHISFPFISFRVQEEESIHGLLAGWKVLKLLSLKSKLQTKSQKHCMHPGLSVPRGWQKGMPCDCLFVKELGSVNLSRFLVQIKTLHPVDIWLPI